MFKLFSNPVKKLRKDYEAKLSEAMQAQRNGDMRLYASLSQEAESLLQKLNELESSQ